MAHSLGIADDSKFTSADRYQRIYVGRVVIGQKHYFFFSLGRP